jgi:hypothetical protein
MCGFLRVRQDGKSVVTGSADGSVRMWNPKDSSCLCPLSLSPPASPLSPSLLLSLPSCLSPLSLSIYPNSHTPSLASSRLLSLALALALASSMALCLDLDLQLSVIVCVCVIVSE